MQIMREKKRGERQCGKQFYSWVKPRDRLMTKAAASTKGYP